MGLFSSIKKAFKKVTRGIGKAVKSVAKGIKNIVKRGFKAVTELDIKEALKIAATIGAIVVTGGSAIGAFGGSLATSTVGSWMVGASNAITGFTIGSVPVGAVFKPFGYLGKAVGSTVGAATDLTGITTKAGRMGYTNIGTAASPNFVVDADKTFKAGAFKGDTLASVKGGTDTAFGLGKAVNTAGEVYKIPAGRVFDAATGTVVDVSGSKLAELTKELGFEAGSLKVGTTGELVNATTGEIINAVGSDTLTGSKIGDFALSTSAGVASSVASGYAQASLMAGDPIGSYGAGLPDEQATLSAQEIGSAYRNINIPVTEAYQNLTYGTGDLGYQASFQGNLFTQPTVAI